MRFSLGVVEVAGAPTLALREGDTVFDAGKWAKAESRLSPALRDALGAASLRPLMLTGKTGWRSANAVLRDALASGQLVEIPTYRERLPLDIPDYVDFYSSLTHVRSAGRILRPAEPDPPRHWFDFPLGYHSRAGSVVVSGTSVSRPSGVRVVDPDSASRGVKYLPSRKVDFEAEVGFVVGKASTRGEPVPVAQFEEYVFGVCIVNDWSARDVQRLEQRPLGPFLSKSFATTMSCWITPLEFLHDARVPAQSNSGNLVSYLRETDSWGMDIELQVEVNGQLISSPSAAELYWSPAQMLAHLTSNGATVRVGDLFASGTVSGPGDHNGGSLLELTVDGTSPIAGTSVRGYLEDGDTVEIRAHARMRDGSRLSLHGATGTLVPGRQSVPTLRCEQTT